MGVPGRSPKDQRPTYSGAEESPVALDVVDRRLLDLLQRDGRMTLSELGRRVGLSPAAVTERIRRLEAGGTITGFAAQVSPVRLGYRITAFVRVAPHGGLALRNPKARPLLERPEVLEAHCVVGEHSWLLKVGVRDTGHLEDLLEQIAFYGPTMTSIVLSTQLARTVVEPLDQAT